MSWSVRGTWIDSTAAAAAAVTTNCGDLHRILRLSFVLWKMFYGKINARFYRGPGLGCGQSYVSCDWYTQCHKTQCWVVGRAVSCDWYTQCHKNQRWVVSRAMCQREAIHGWRLPQFAVAQSLYNRIRWPYNRVSCPFKLIFTLGIRIFATYFHNFW